MSDDILDELFSCIERESAEDLWLIVIEKYLNRGDGVANSVFGCENWTLLHYASENLFKKL